MREHDNPAVEAYLEDMADHIDDHADRVDPKTAESLALLKDFPERVEAARLASLSPARRRHLELFGDVPAVTRIRIGPLDAVRPQGTRSARRAAARAAAADRHRKATGR